MTDIWHNNEYNEWVASGASRNMSVTVLRLTRAVVSPILFNNLPALVELSLEDCNLTDIPNTIGDLTELRKLVLSRNRITRLPDTIGSLLNLLRLQLDNNQLSDLPNSIANLVNLRDLNLTNNQFSTFPEVIFALRNLHILSFAGNQLTVLPDAIGNFPNMTTLFLGDNRLDRLPDTIGNLGQLYNLSVRNNRLSELPESIGRMEQLRMLDFNNNNVSVLPQSILDMRPQLVVFNMYRNPVARTVRPATAPTLPAPRPPPPQPQGIAYEIHNVFNRINPEVVIRFFASKMNAELLASLGEKSDSQFKDMLRTTVSTLLDQLSESDMRAIPPKASGYYPTNTTTWMDIWNDIYNSRIVNINYGDVDATVKKIIGMSLYYVMEQPIEFRNNYVLAYLGDVAFAYNTGDNLQSNYSCIRGINERFLTSIKTAIDAVLTKKDHESDVVEEYIQLRKLIVGSVSPELLRQHVVEWQAANKNVITENSEFKTNKDALVAQQKDHLIRYLCCNLGVTQEELMADQHAVTTIEYVFSDRNIMDYGLGGCRKTRNRRRNKKKASMATKKRAVSKKRKTRRRGK